MNKRKQEKKLRNRKDKEFRLSVKERDGNKCVICGDINKVNVHHLIPREVKFTRHLLDNGISLCVKHHKFCLKLSAHRNPLMFYMWLVINKKEQLERLLEEIKDD